MDKDSPCNGCTRTPNPEICPRYRDCPEYKKWFKAAWGAAGGKVAPEKKKEPVRVVAPDGVHCIVCGQLIPPKSGRYLYCSEECRKSHNKPERSRFCANCGKPITDPKKIRYCSELCRLQHKRKREIAEERSYKND